jgi:hypothetical protein
VPSGTAREDIMAFDPLTSAFTADNAAALFEASALAYEDEKTFKAGIAGKFGTLNSQFEQQTHHKAQCRMKVSVTFLRKYFKTAQIEIHSLPD